MAAAVQLQLYRFQLAGFRSLNFVAADNGRSIFAATAAVLLLLSSCWSGVSHRIGRSVYRQPGRSTDLVAIPACECRLLRVCSASTLSPADREFLSDFQLHQPRKWHMPDVL